jgi:ADP-L-glycero-D-manno-heptose 6-epimerase
MILVTGGAGFIGSNLQAALVRRGIETVIIDHLGSAGKWRNLAKHAPARLLPPSDIDAFLESRPPLEMVFHLGAVSDTTATDGDTAWATNVELSRQIWHWCANHGVRLVYASSAATYGDGSAGFDDDASVAGLEKLRPLNLYGWTKHAFDLRVARVMAERRPHPPQWVGLKFFNVYGPNEYHKGAMMSVLCKVFDDAKAGKPVRLFKSYRDGIADGDQRRDFIYVDDAIAVIGWLLETPSVCGLFNVGTGKAGSFREMIEAMFAAHGRPPDIEYIDMPAAIRDSYQYFTQASVENLRRAGYGASFTPLAAAVRHYVGEFLDRADRYR